MQDVCQKKTMCKTYTKDSIWTLRSQGHLLENPIKPTAHIISCSTGLMSSSELGFTVQHFFYELWTEVRMDCVCGSVCKAMFISSLRKVNRNPPKYQKYIKVQISLRNSMRILVKNTSSFCLTMTLSSISKAHSVIFFCCCCCYLPVFLFLWFVCSEIISQFYLCVF